MLLPAQLSRLRSTAWMTFLVILCCICAYPLSASAETDNNSAIDQLMPAVGSVLVETGQQQWQAALDDLQQVQQMWDTLQIKEPPIDTTLTNAIDTALTDSRQKLETKDVQGSKQSLSLLAKSIDQYITAVQPKSEQDTTSGPETAGKLLPYAKESMIAMEQQDWKIAEESYQKIVNDWKKSESAIRLDQFNVYGQLETQISLIRINLQADPMKEDQAKLQMQKLITILEDYSAGKINNSLTTDKHSIKDLLQVLQSARSQVQNGQIDQAAQQMEQFISVWPSVEGEVQLYSAKLYTEIENQMTAVSGYLLSNPPVLAKATQTMDDMLASLEPISSNQTYTAWDAALILLREGLEAILVLAALLSYLKRSGNSNARKWVWSGAGIGLVLSFILAIVLHYTISQATSGSTREFIEGITGLVAVVMMLTVGYWMHSKASTTAWNNYVKDQVNNALAKGSLWSVFAVSGLAILREGAETTIFYVGMAPSIEPFQLILGISIALAILIVVGYAIIVLSVQLPIRGFFLTATLLIYYLVLRFLGQSIHSLQVAGQFPAHTHEYLPSISWLGMYPTWETSIPQFILLGYIIWQFVFKKSK
ncbi:high-affinity iron transporter [Paenibacillus sp. DS2015]|uniref:FTR1 family iron permease n=1 Tax=Paenibacillus sp. DS2015 TaxID=3373917 RepID=UPI003D25403F